MNEKILDFLQQEKEKTKRGLRDISADFADDGTRSAWGGDIDNAFHECADLATDDYYSNLIEWAGENWEYVAAAAAEYGRAPDFWGEIRQAQYFKAFEDLNQDRENIVKYLTFDFLENNPALADFLGLERLQELAGVGNFDIWDLDNIFENIENNFDDINFPELDAFEKIDKVLNTPENIKGVKHTADGFGFSVLVEHAPANVALWVDVWIEDKDINADWNKYIFYLDDSNDLAQKTIQENTDIFDYFTSAAIDYLQAAGLIHQNDAGEWVRK